MPWSTPTAPRPYGLKPANLTMKQKGSPIRCQPILIRLRQCLDLFWDFASQVFFWLSLMVLFAVLYALSRKNLPFHLVLLLPGLRLILWFVNREHLSDLKNELTHILQRWPMPTPYVPSALRATLARLNQECADWEYKPRGKWTVYLDCSTKNDYYVSCAFPFRKGRAVFLSARLLDVVGEEMAPMLLDFLLSRKHDPRLGPTAFVSALAVAYCVQSTDTHILLWMLLLVLLMTRLFACALREEILATDLRIATRISFAKWHQFAETASRLNSVMGIFADSTSTIRKAAHMLFCWPISLGLPDRIKRVRLKCG